MTKSMERTTATALVLVNWRGVFYERYLLDRNVTALEGANGAGKTTVMIAAYVVLLPDLTRLRFTNLGESGATGGDRGIWGRLGELGRPSYAALQLQMADGERIVLGVHLERKTEPALELTPFLVRSLPESVPLQRLLLRQRDGYDEVPTLDQLKQSAIECNAKLVVCTSTKDYFARLFDLGISPMRLTGDEERNKWNDMLRTSMTGGISRALTTQLREFVFKQDTGLADTLGRMRANLAACRRTRIEVGESRVLEQEISGVYEAGAAMFTASLLASRARARELEAALRAAEREHEQASEQLSELSSAAQELVVRRATLAERRQRAAEAKQAATAHVHQVERALTASERLKRLERQLQQAQSELENKARAQSQAVERRQDAMRARDEAQAAVARAAQGLADLQSGLDELHRRAHTHRLVCERLEQARRGLKVAQLEVTELDGVVDRVREELRQLDNERVRRERESADLQAKRREYNRAFQALRQLTDNASDASDAFAVGRRELARLHAAERLAARAPELAREREQIVNLARRQADLRDELERHSLSEVDAAGFLQHLQELDRQCRELQDEEREATWQLRLLDQRQEELGRELLQLEERQAQWQRVSEVCGRLTPFVPELAPEPASLREARSSLRGEFEAHQRQLEQLAEQRQQASERIAQLESGHDLRMDPAVLQICDELEGELLARRFDELESEQARYVEAQLGPWLHAVVVEDIDAAKQRLDASGLEGTSLWLVQAGADLPVKLEAPSELPQLASMATPFGERLTRVPERASLGQRARQAQLKEWRRRAATLETELEQTIQSARSFGDALHDLDLLERQVEVWKLGDPRKRLGALTELLEETHRAQGRERERAAAARSRLAESRARADDLRPLMANAALLDGPDHNQRLDEMDRELRDAQAAQRELEAVAEARRVLTDSLEALRWQLPSDEELQRWSSEHEQACARRDELFEVDQALTFVQQHRTALDWHEVVEQLAARERLSPRLGALHAEALGRAAASQEALTAADAAWEQVTLELQEAQAELAALRAHQQRAEQELLGEGVSHPSEHTLTLARAQMAEAERHAAEVEGESNTIAERTARAEERCAQARQQVSAAENEVSRLRQQAAPAEQQWERLRTQAEDMDLLSTALEEAEAYTGWTSQQLQPEARSQARLLLDRLAAARGGAPLTEELQGQWDAGFDADECLSTWQAVRGWLTQRVPARIAESQDPLLALARLRDDLRRLEGRLQRQEDDLKGHSRDVARNIEVQIRKATNRVRRLNQFLNDVRFGSIAGIRIRMGRAERSERILTALRDGSAQALLFQSSMPIEEALDEIFRRYGAGRGGGQRLLDYREYIELTVQIQRRQSQTWEDANASRLSTGEAIGVGAALMMVILTEWERDANLLRSKRCGGALRFLFLDEANRLSQDNLGTLFELCENLQLQLLIAAPEVAHVDGNTTYRLVRRVNEDGVEEVVASGRRKQLPEVESSTCATA